MAFESSSITTRLQAVNTMLMVVGEITVSAIDGQSYEVDKADEILSEVVRDLCTEANFMNEERDVTLSADGNSEYTLSSNIVHFIPNSAAIQAVPRDGKLYNLETGSYTFSEATITGKKVYLLDFDELPEGAKRYATIRASRIFADRFVGSQGIRAFSLQDELEAKSKFMLNEQAMDRTNAIADNYSTIRTVLRRGGNINPERLY
jgi:hypothetical protein